MKISGFKKDQKQEISEKEQQLEEKKLEKKLFIEFHKRFAQGEQYLKVERGKIVEDYNLNYYWQCHEVFNRIPEMIEIWKHETNKKSNTLIYGKNGLVSRLIPVQRAYNKIMNTKMEIINQIKYGVLMVEDGSVDVDVLEEEGLAPGKILVYRQGANVPQLMAPVISDQSLIFIDKYIDNLEKVFYSIAKNNLNIGSISHEFSEVCLSKQEVL